MKNLQNRHLKIALTDTGGAKWTGGITYRKNLLEALQLYAPAVDIVAITEEDGKLYDYPNCQVIYSPSPKSTLEKFAQRSAIHFLNRDFQLQKALKAIPGGVDLVFPGRYSVGKGIGVLYWIPDFQHLHLPNLYSKAHLSDLNFKFYEGIKQATLVLLSSHDAKQDFLKFAPSFISKARVLNFVAHIPACLYNQDPTFVIKKYNIPSKFFYLPNQFWVHKNHKLVLEALKILKDKGVYPFMVLTGNPIDIRNPSYFAELLQIISCSGLRDQIAILGLISHDDVYALIRQSICVINPSLFEGWSTTVEEVKSVGKRILLSDLRVHREQNPPSCLFFDPNNSQQLANLMEQIWDESVPGQDLTLEQQAREIYPIHMKTFADNFVAIAQETAVIANGKS